MENMPILIGVFGAVMVISLFLAVTSMLRELKSDNSFAEQLKNVSRSEFDTEAKEENAIERWNRYWYEKNLRAGGNSRDIDGPGRTAIILAGVGLVVGSIVLSNIIVGIIASGILVFSYSSILSIKRSKRVKKMEAQIPSLLFDMRANLQSNQTATQSIMNVVDDMQEPLGEELALMREEVNVGIPLETALRNLAYRVGSSEMAFLVASIEIAVISGTDLEPQLKIIQNITEERQKSAYKLSAAIASVQPTLWISGLVIPIGFIWSWFSDPSNREYWTTLQGMIFGGVITILYGIGFILSNRLVKTIEKA